MIPGIYVIHGAEGDRTPDPNTASVVLSQTELQPQIIQRSRNNLLNCFRRVNTFYQYQPRHAGPDQFPPPSFWVILVHESFRVTVLLNTSLFDVVSGSTQ